MLDTIIKALCRGSSLRRQVEISPQGDLYVANMARPFHELCNAGAYFATTNPTPSTAIAYGIVTAFAATSAMVCIRSNDPSGQKQVWIDYIKLILSVAPAAATSGQYAIAVDNINRFTSGGSSLTPRNTHAGRIDRSIARVDVGDMTIAAAGPDVKLIARGILRATIPIVGDVYTWVFGSHEKTQTGNDTGGGGASKFLFPAPPVILGSGGSLAPGQQGTHSLLLHLWFPANAVTPPTFEMEIGWWER